MAHGLEGRLEDRVFVVTGGGTGIGAASAVACAKAGMDVLLVGRRSEPLEKVASQVRAEGRRAEVLSIDVSEDGASQNILDTAEQRLGGFDVVFANAGYGAEMPVIHMEEADIRRMMDVNFIATAFLLREAGARMVQQKRKGHLLACSSCLSKYTIPHFGLYAATKAAQNMLCRSMRFELRPNGIEVASVHPVTTRTEFFEAALQHSGRHAGMLRNSIPSSPRPFVQTPERVARAIVRCLRRPRSEVWTSLGARWAGGAFEFAPWLYDLVLHTMARRSRREMARSEAETTSEGT
ncbi:MAG: SDR family oxidoreductase [Phycisphaerales bacterium]|nr:SDR family oxidoreductase [Phycisphaerales bacterium]